MNNFRWLLNGEPRPVQVEATKLSLGQRGWGHFLDMRLGKTSVALNEFEMYKADYDLDWHVVFTVNNFKYDWGVEADKWGISVPHFIYEARTRREFEKWRKKNDEGMVVVNFEALNSVETIAHISELVTPHSMVTVDESIQIKNPKSVRFKEIYKMSRGARFLRALTGKPVAKGSHDYWTQLTFIGGIKDVNYHAFRNRYCVMGGFAGKQVIGVKNEAQLHAILDKCSWTARRGDWGVGLPKDYLPLRPILLGPDQQALYDQMERDFLLEIADDVITADQVITKYVKLQQIASGFVYDEMGKARMLVDPAKNPKFLEIRRVMEEEYQGKAIVYCNFNPTIDIALETLREFNPAFIRGRSRMGDTTVIEQKAKFNEDPSCRVIVCQIEASKYGHNLVGMEGDWANLMIYAENSYSLDARSQTEDRNQGTHMVEGSQNPMILDFFTSPIDMHVIENLRKKEDIAAVLMRYARKSGVLPSEGV